MLASLNHPNIAAIYGVEDHALVMELVEGPTLAERIKQGPIPLDEALASRGRSPKALEAAHDKGIVHRDLKPANIKITPRRHGEAARLRPGQSRGRGARRRRRRRADAHGEHASART